MREKVGRGLHPRLAVWVHRELAAVCLDRRKVLHLLCADLARNRPLRRYDDVVSSQT
jgi:hypothetical protein